MPTATIEKDGLMSADDKIMQIKHIRNAESNKLFRLSFTKAEWVRNGIILFHVNETMTELYLIMSYQSGSSYRVDISKCLGKKNDVIKFYKKDNCIYFTTTRDEDKYESYFIISDVNYEYIGTNTIIDDTFEEIVPTT